MICAVHIYFYLSELLYEFSKQLKSLFIIYSLFLNWRMFGVRNHIRNDNVLHCTIYIHWPGNYRDVFRKIKNMHCWWHRHIHFMFIFLSQLDNILYIIVDCGNHTLQNGRFITANGTTFGQVGRQECNIGFDLIGEQNLTCTVNGWSNTSAYCKIIGRNVHLIQY